MNYKNALRLYMSRKEVDEVIVKRLMKWDESKSIRENSMIISTNSNVARVMAKRYGLKYKTIGKGYWRNK